MSNEDEKQSALNYIHQLTKDDKAVKIHKNIDDYVYSTFINIFSKKLANRQKKLEEKRKIYQKDSHSEEIKKLKYPKPILKRSSTSSISDDDTTSNENKNLKMDEVKRKTKVPSSDLSGEESEESEKENEFKKYERKRRPYNNHYDTNDEKLEEKQFSSYNRKNSFTNSRSRSRSSSFDRKFNYHPDSKSFQYDKNSIPLNIMEDFNNVLHKKLEGLKNQFDEYNKII